MKSILLLISRVIIAFSFILLIRQIVFYLFPRDVQLFIPSMAIATLVLIFIFKNDKNLSLGFDQKNGAIYNAKGLLLGIVLISLSFMGIWASQSIEIVKVSFTKAHLSSIISTTILFFIISFQEELFFRGYLYSFTKKLFQKRAALWVTSVLFSFTHALNPNALSTPIPLISIFIAGLLLGLLREYSGSLWLPIGFHWSWNLFQGSIFGFQVSGIPIHSIIQLKTMGSPILSGGEFGAEGSILTSLVLLGCIITLYYFQKKPSALLREIE